MEVLTPLTVVGGITWCNSGTPIRALDAGQASWIWAVWTRVLTWVSLPVDVEGFTTRPAVAAAVSTVINIV